jgi:hypothetical protein
MRLKSFSPLACLHKPLFIQSRSAQCFCQSINPNNINFEFTHSPTNNMSYAIETKKRKFDRVLDAIVGDSSAANSPSRASIKSHEHINGSSTSLALDSASDSSKRRRITPTSKTTISSISSDSDLTNHYLPSSRQAFLQRLETFRHVTIWHVSSTDSISAAAWAKRGWTCVDTDTVGCGVCKERLYIDLSLNEERLRSKDDENNAKPQEETNDEDSFDMSVELHEALMTRYQSMIITAHSESCLWRKRGCDTSIQRIEGLLNTSSALSAMRTRYESIMQRSEEIPAVESLPVTTYAAPEELDTFMSNTESSLNSDALRLAIAGWTRRAEDVVDCKHCFRSLGLWLYRGDTPMIEKLDAVENHLEYCPWRDAKAQDTEITVGRYDDTEAIRKKMVPGWALVYQAIAKNNKQRIGTKAAPSITSSELPPSTSGSDSMASEQREKKMKDLLKRVKDARKVFDVKGLLRRKTNKDREEGKS